MKKYINGTYLAELRKFIQNLVDVLGDVFLETY